MTRQQHPISLPAVLLVLASALRCSNACISAGAAIAITAGVTAASVGSVAAMAELEKNRTARIGNLALPAVTTDPASIEQALRPALPSRSANSAPDPKRLQVVLRAQGPGETEVRIYDINAYDNFTKDYAQAFANFANRIRSQLPGRTKFIISAYKNASGGPKLIARLEVD